MIIARLKTAAVRCTTDFIPSPSRTCRCQSSGYSIVIWSACIVAYLCSCLAQWNWEQGNGGKCKLGIKFRGRGLLQILKVFISVRKICFRKNYKSCLICYANILSQTSIRLYELVIGRIKLNQLANSWKKSSSLVKLYTYQFCYILVSIKYGTLRNFMKLVFDKFIARLMYCINFQQFYYQHFNTDYQLR